MLWLLRGAFGPAAFGGRKMEAVKFLQARDVSKKLAERFSVLEKMCLELDLCLTCEFEEDDDSVANFFLYYIPLLSFSKEEAGDYHGGLMMNYASLDEVDEAITVLYRYHDYQDMLPYIKNEIEKGEKKNDKTN